PSRAGAPPAPALEALPPPIVAPSPAARGTAPPPPPGRAPPPPAPASPPAPAFAPRHSRANGSSASGMGTGGSAPQTPVLNGGGAVSRIPSPPSVLALPNAPTRTFPPSAQFPPPRPFDAGAVMGRRKLGGWDYRAHMG
ncbi:hypothetical protein JCM10207_001280, partial [Rhodosporidiobolus poonsookiae]